MAQTFTLDTLRSGRVVITKNPDDPPVLQAEYDVATADGRFSLHKVTEVPLNSSQQTQLTSLLVAVLNYIKGLESIS